MLLTTIVPTISVAGTLSGSVSGNLPVSGSPYTVTATITVPAGQTLSIDPGVILNMSAGTSFMVNGTLKALGNLASPIQITSTQPMAGQWNSLTFVGSTSATQLSNVQIHYGQQVTLQNASPQWTQVTISSMSTMAVSSDLNSFPTGSGNVATATPLNCINLSAGSIGGTVQWNNIDLPYCSGAGRITVPTGARLTIEPGVVIKSYGNNSFAVLDGGTLLSLGTSAKPVVFTGLSDDSVDGDTNNDGSASAGSPGAWGGIQLIRASGTFQYTVLRYGGLGYQLTYDLQQSGSHTPVPPIEIWGSTATVDNVQVSTTFQNGIVGDYGSSVTITNSQISQSSLNGLFTDSHSKVSIRNCVLSANAQDGWAIGTGGSVGSIQNSVIQGNSGNGISGVDAGLTVSGSTITANAKLGLTATADQQGYVLSGNTVQGNNINGLGIVGTISSTVQWLDIGMPYTITSGRVTVGTGGHLTLGPGVVVKGNDGDSIAVIDGGTLASLGSAKRPVVFTSLTDDSIDGDTNSDGSATLPSPGGWGGIQFIRASGQLQNTIVRYSGRGPELTYDLQNVPGDSAVAAIQPWGSTVTLTTVQISSGSQHGIWTDFGSSVTVSSSIVLANNGNGIYNDGGSKTSIHASSILKNINFGVFNNDPSVTVNATSNYWGAATGPTTSGNPSGTGDRVTELVLYSPFLSTAVGGIVNPSDALPPRTTLVEGLPHSSGFSPVAIASSTALTFSVVDDLVVVGDGQGDGVKQTQYKIDSGAYVVYSASFTVAQAGTHTITYNSVDVDGHTEVSTSTVMIVVPKANVSPTTQINYGSPFALEASSKTFISTATLVSFAVNNQGNGTRFTRYSLDGQAYQTYASSFTLPAGAHALLYQSQDLLGDLESPRGSSVTVDGLAPSVTVIFSPDGKVDASSHVLIDTATRVGFQLQDDLSGLATAEYKLDAAAFQMYRSTFSLSAGQHTLSAIFIDAVGNTKSITPFTISVSTADPDTSGSSSTSGTLPDGTPVIGSPAPVTVPPPPIVTTPPTGNPTAPTTVQSVAFSPPSPVGRGPLTVTIQFSKAMNNTVYPSVAYSVGGSAPVILSPSTYVGATWTGSATIPPSSPSGAATLTVQNAKDASGATVANASFAFQINNPLPAAPGSLSVSANATVGALQVNWQPAAGTSPSSYNLYRSSSVITLRNGLTPMTTGLTLTSSQDVPPIAFQTVYYGVTAFDANGVESLLSATTAYALPFPPSISTPTATAVVDVSSINISGLAQPGASISLSVGLSTAAIATASVASDHTWTARLTLPAGTYTLSARAQNPTTKVTSVATMVTLHVGLLPIAPTNLHATVGDTTVTLNWTLSTQSTAAGYNIYRDAATVPLNVAPLPVTQGSYQDLALTDGRVYRYMMTTVSTDKIESYPTTAISATPLAGPGWAK